MDEAFFRAAYERDAANRTRQPWDEHWRWVRVFYDGKRLPPIPGWTRRQVDMLARVPAARRSEADARLTVAAQKLASEWAKDNALRKVSSDDLRAWGKRFEAAAGDADMLVATIEEVEAEITARTG